MTDTRENVGLECDAPPSACLLPLGRFEQETAEGADYRTLERMEQSI